MGREGQVRGEERTGTQGGKDRYMLSWRGNREIGGCTTTHTRSKVYTYMYMGLEECDRRVFNYT